MNNYTNPVTVTGNPASFEASGNGKLLSLSVPFSPIQDLHGYDSPWPAGGGKNLCANVLQGHINTNVNPRIFVIDNNSESAVFYATQGTTYHVSSSIALTRSQIGHCADSDITSGETLLDYVSNTGTYTWTATWTGWTVWYVYPSKNTSLESSLQVEIGSTATSYEPYSNICHITGRTGLNVYDDPKYGGTIEWNQLMKANASGGASGVSAMFNITTGELTLDGTASAVAYIRFLTESVTDHVYYVNDGGLRSSYPGEAFIYNDNGGVIALTGTTIGKATSNKAFYARANSGVTFSNYTCKPIIIDLTQMFGSTIADYIYALETANAGAGVAWFRNLFPKDYYPYNAGEQTCVSAVNGDPYWKKDIDWTTSAGTVYGGTLDVVTGVLTVDRAIVDLGTLTWNYNASWGGYPAFYCSAAPTGIKTPSVVGGALTGALCSQYIEVTRNYLFSHNETAFYVPNDGKISIRDTRYTSASDFQSAMNGVQLCYTLATPITYQLTATQVELLIGQNNVWSDSNESVTLTYVIELFTRYTFIVNGNDYTGLVERDSYRTAVTPVYGETIQTLDGVSHTALLRVKGSLTVKLNPQTAAQTAAICTDLLNAPCEVQYKCLQRNVNVTALMVLDAVSAMFLSRCMYLGQKWNDVDEIVLKEL